MSDLRFQKLTPTSNVDLNVYEEGFEFIFSNDDIRNIAVSGPYSSGKSSLLESYKKKYPQKTFIHISLAHFTNENKDNEEKEIKDSETVIEGKILNQLIQQIPIENIPQSNFRIKRTTGTNYNGYWAMGIVAFIGMLLFVLNYGKYCTWINEMNSAVWNYEWLRKFMFFLASPFGWVLSVLCIVVIACLGLYNLLNIQTNKNIFKKISVQGNEIEIFEDSQNSYFDKYLNEVLYLFENSKADVIVFEDIDRFENVQIFERLREINMLTNCRLQQHEEEEKVLRFFYLLKDDIFITKDRAKFFDYILPVVPVLDSSNSYNKIKEFFAKKKKRIGFYDYDKCWKNILTDAKKAPRDTYLCGFVRYDDSPRRGNKARIILNESPEKFGEYMKKLMTISKKQNKEFVFLMAWNEWGEGAYLEPDTVDGNSYLEILKKVIDEINR